MSPNMHQYYRRCLVGLFNQVQMLRVDPHARIETCLTIQETLVEKITYVESRIRKRKSSRKSLLKRLTVGQPVRLDKAGARAIKDQISASSGTVDEYHLLLDTLRQVGDSLAFMYLDKWDIKPLSFGQPPGFISHKKGLRQELRVLRGLFASGQVAILNDITNCLRYGDITIPKYGRPFFVEVKSSNRIDSRARRQISKAQRVREYLSKDKAEDLYGLKGEFRRFEVHAQEIHHRERLNSLIGAAVNNGVGYAEVEEGLHYLVSTGASPNPLDPIKDKCYGTGIVSLVNELKHGNTGYYPFTLSFSDPEALYDFYRGWLFILILVDSGVITRKLGSQGLEVELLSDEDCAFEIRRREYSTGGRRPFRIGRHLFGRVFAEFVSLDWLLQEIVDKMQRLEAALEVTEEEQSKWVVN